MNSSPSCIRGEFRGFNVTIIGNKKIRIENPNRIPMCEFKDQIDAIARYLIHEGFVSTFQPLIEISQPKAP